MKHIITSTDAETQRRYIKKDYPCHAHPHADAHTHTQMSLHARKDSKDAFRIHANRVPAHRSVATKSQRRTQKDGTGHRNVCKNTLKKAFSLRITVIWLGHKATNRERRRKEWKRNTHTLSAAQAEVIFINKPSDNKHTYIKAFALPPSLLHTPSLT